MATWIGQARKRNQQLGSIAYDTGQNVPRRLDLRNAGYLERLRLIHTATFTYATAGPTAVDKFGEYGGVLNRITVQANSIGNLFDTSGETAAIISAIDAAYNTGSALVTPNPYAFTASPGTSATTDKFPYDIPIALNMVNKPWPIGFFQTALNSQETSLEVRFNPVATAGSIGTGLYTGNAANNTAANNTGSLAIQQIYFDPIADPQAQPSLAFIHQWREWQQPISSDGSNEFRLPPSNYYCRLIYQVVTGSTPALDSTHITRLRLMYGANLAPYDETYDAVVARMARQYGFNWPTDLQGVMVHDFLADTHTERDIINAGATTDLRAVIDTSGATYSGSYVKMAAEQLIPLVIPPANAQGVQGQANVSAA